MKQRWTGRNRLVKSVAAFALLSGLLALLDLYIIFSGADWRSVVAVMIAWLFMTAVSIGLAIVSVARRVDAARRAMTRELERLSDGLIATTSHFERLSVGLEQRGVELQMIRKALAQFAEETPGWANKLDSGLRECIQEIADTESQIMKSIGVTNRSVMKLDTAVRSRDLARKIEDQSRSIEASSFNIARSQRQLEFALLKDRTQAD